MLTMNVRSGSNSLIRRYWLNVRFARKRTRLADFMNTRPYARTYVLAPPMAKSVRVAKPRAACVGARPAGGGLRLGATADL